MKKLIPHLLIIVFGLIFGYFIWQSFYGDLPPSHSLNWGTAQWITTPAPSPIGLFRKELFVSNKVLYGWIQISASDTYHLAVNEKAVVANAFYNSNVSGVHDLTSYLRPGKNVVAISVRRLSFPGSSQTIVRGAYMDASGNETIFFSDGSWKALNREDFYGNISWVSPRFDATSWPPAKTLKGAEPGETYPVTLPSRAITAPLNALWIQHPSPFPEKTNFRKDFNLPERPVDAWIRISTDTDYELVVNGTKVGKGNAALTLDIFSITPLLRKGDNTVGIALKNPLQRAYALYADGEVRGEGFQLSILTDSDWKAYLPNNNHQFDQPFAIGGYSSYQLLNRPKIVRELTLPIDYEVKRFLEEVGVIGLVMFLTYMLVLIISRAMCSISKGSISDCFSIASFALVIPTILLIFLGILQFDIRMELRDLFRPLVVYGILLFTFCLQIFITGWLKYSGVKESTEPVSVSQDKKYKRILIALIVLCLIIVGAFLRLDNLGYISLNGDEIGTVRFAQGILKKGYPYLTLGDIEKPATTYELLPYYVVPSISLLGINPTSIRLHSAFFGIATIFLIFWVGMRLVNVQTGLLASAIYTFMPSAINLAQNARYMVTEQFLTLLCCYFYYKAIEKEEIDRRAVYLASLFFSITYLTWEGSGYLLPSLLVATFLLKGRDLGWLKNWHLWLASVIAGMVVLIQIYHRTYRSIPFMIIGSGLSESTFKLMFLYQEYNPWYYVNNFLLTQSHMFHTLLIIIGLPIIFFKKELRYLLTIFFCVLFFFSNTFSLYATRYAYFMQPLLIILSSAALIKLAELASGVVKGYRVPVLNVLRYSIPFVLSFLFFITNNDYTLKLYRLSSNPTPTENIKAIDVRSIADERRNIYPVDFRGANLFVKENLCEGDMIVTVYSHPTLFFVGQVDYFEETIVDTQIVYMDNNDYPRLINKTVDIPSITTLSEFKNLLCRHKRIWFIATSFDLFNYLNEKGFLFYFLRTMKPVYESYRTRVYLWENGKRI